MSNVRSVQLRHDSSLDRCASHDPSTTSGTPDATTTQADGRGGNVSSHASHTSTSGIRIRSTYSILLSRPSSSWKRAPVAIEGRCNPASTCSDDGGSIQS